MRGMTELPQPIAAWANRHWPVLTAFGYALSFALLFGGTALATYHAGVADQTAALLCGAAAILFARLYVRIVRRIARLIDALRPLKPDQAAKPPIPHWAVVIYAMLGVALAVAITDPESRSIPAAIEFFVAWLAGCWVLHYLWRRRTDPASPRALDIIDRWLDEHVAPHWPKLRRPGYVLCFALLFGGVALHAFQTGFARTAVAQCGSTCAIPGAVYLVAALCGVAAILFVIIYTAMAETVQLALVDSWKHVRPGPPPPDVPRWVSVLYGLIGLAVFIAIAVVGEAGAAPGQTGHTSMTVEGSDGYVTLDGQALLELLLGWWIGGLALLRFFWLRRRATR